MAVELSSNAKRALATIYRDYCQRRDYGQKGLNAVFFASYPEFVRQALTELCVAGYTEYSILDGFILTNQGISFMENQDSALISLWLRAGSQIIP